MRSSARVILRAPDRISGALTRTNKAAGVAIVILACLFWAQFLRPQSLGGNAGYVPSRTEHGAALPHR